MKEISKETINKIAQVKLKSGRQKILEGFIKNDIPEQADNKLAIPSHRTRKQIPFDEFKTLISQGSSLQELCRKYSKHLMAFYSYLSKGKITLTKEEFEDQYNKGIPLDEIARANNIPREYITYLREYYGIKRKGATYQRRLKNEVPLSQEAKDVIIGSLLGDGHITPLGYFSEKHSEKQVEYLEWKAKFLKPILTPKSFAVYSCYDKRYNKTNYSFCLRTIAHSFLYEMREKFYKKINGEWVKIIPDDIENMLSDMALAIWFMDDGNTDWTYRNGIKQYQLALPQCKISSESFSLEDNIRLQSFLSIKHGLNSNISFKNRGNNIKQPYLRIDCESSVKLINLVKQFATEDMLYKVNEGEYLRHNKKIYNKDLVISEFKKKHYVDQK